MQIIFPELNLFNLHTSSYLCDNTAYILLHPSSDPSNTLTKASCGTAALITTPYVASLACTLSIFLKPGLD